MVKLQVQGHNNPYLDGVCSILTWPGMQVPEVGYFCVEQEGEVHPTATPTKATPGVLKGSLAGLHSRSGPYLMET